MRAAALLLLCGSVTASPLRRLHGPSTIPDDWVAVPGEVDGTATVRVQIGIKRSNVDQLEETLKRTSDPDGPYYLQHLTWEQVGDLVRPPQERVQRVMQWLAAAGAADIELHPHQDSAAATFTVAQIEAAAGGRFTLFKHAATGETLARMTSGVWVPADIADSIDTFTGFHGFPLPRTRAAASGNASAPLTGVTPSLINSVYKIPQVAKSGKTNIQAIAQFQGQYVKASDLSSFCKKYEPSGGDCAIAKFIGSNGGGTAGVESMLDTEYIMGLGQGHETWVYSYPSFDFCNDLLTWGSDVTKNATFPYVVSMSYGSQKIDFCPSATISRLSQDIQKMGTMGVTVTISSGDDGSGHSTRQGTNTGKVSPSFPASIPYCVAVGSTYFVSGTSGTESASSQFGSGGGFSYDFTAPSYQETAVSGYLAKTSKPKEGLTYATGGRGTPDVSLLGEQFQVVVNGATESVGGTSASAPSFGAMMTLLNEVCLKAGGKSLGFVLPLLYKNAAAFTDITKGTSAIGGNQAAGVWEAATGWDACTGLGTPDFAKLQTVVEKSCSAAARRN